MNWQALPPVWAKLYLSAERLEARLDELNASRFRVLVDGQDAGGVDLPSREAEQMTARIFPSHRFTRASILREIMVRWACRYPFAQELEIQALWASTDGGKRHSVVRLQKQFEGVAA